GLHLAMARGIPPRKIPPLLQQLVPKVRAWPHFVKPAEWVQLTAFDVAMAGTPELHIQLVRDWASAVWTAWSPCHKEVAAFVVQHIDLNT
ncbi:MAG TPA: DUF5946 family protein, partial [Acidobacteriota bacterium]|nr:DUF5946 family protein [Acidobacteriota bacterium]